MSLCHKLWFSNSYIFSMLYLSINVVDIWHFKLWLLLDHWVLKILGLENPNLWQGLNSFLFSVYSENHGYERNFFRFDISMILNIRGKIFKFSLSDLEESNICSQPFNLIRIENIRINSFSLEKVAYNVETWSSYFSKSNPSFQIFF